MLECQRRFRRTGECVQLVDAMFPEKRFLGKAFGSFAAEIKCNSLYQATIMEGCVSGFLMGAFLTKTSANTLLPISECRIHMGGYQFTVYAPCHRLVGEFCARRAQ